MSRSQTPPVGTQEERDLDSRLDHAISTSSSLIEEALLQLATPCQAPMDNNDEDEDDFLPHLDLAVSKSTLLLEEAQKQLKSPRIAPAELTIPEITERKGTEAWDQTYILIKQMNDLRADAGRDLCTSVLNDIEEADESGELVHNPKCPTQSTKDWVLSAANYREERRARRLSRKCAGVRVAAVVATIEAIDQEAAAVPCLPQKHVRNASVRSFGK